MLYVRREDLDPATGKLKAGVPVEPRVLRANAGECIEVILGNRLPEAMPDLPTYAIMMGGNRDRFGEGGASTFSSNLMRPSSLPGLRPGRTAFPQPVLGRRAPVENIAAPSLES